MTGALLTVRFACEKKRGTNLLRYQCSVIPAAITLLTVRMQIGGNGERVSRYYLRARVSLLRLIAISADVAHLKGLSSERTLAVYVSRCLRGPEKCGCTFESYLRTRPFIESRGEVLEYWVIPVVSFGIEPTAEVNDDFIVATERLHWWGRGVVKCRREKAKYLGRRQFLTLIPFFCARPSVSRYWDSWQRNDNIACPAECDFGHRVGAWEAEDMYICVRCLLRIF